MSTDLKSKVYVANFAGHDFTPAQEYGELCYLTKGYISFQSLDRLKYVIAEALQQSKPEDYLALSGTNIINVLAAVLWLEMHEQVKILNYDKTTNSYRLIVLTRGSNLQLLEGLKGEQA